MLFSLSNLYSSIIFATSPHFLKNKQNSNPDPICKVGEIQLWLIKTTCLTYVTKNRSSNNKNIEFEIWECFIY